MKPHEETWTVHPCGNPIHGPAWKCWKVKNEKSEVVLSGVDKATSERYAAFPGLARALLVRLDACGHLPLCPVTAGCNPDCGALRSLLIKAGVLP